MQQRQALGHDSLRVKAGAGSPRSSPDMVHIQDSRAPAPLLSLYPTSSPKQRQLWLRVLGFMTLYSANFITSILEEKKEKSLSVRLILWSNLLSHSRNVLITVLKMSVKLNGTESSVLVSASQPTVSCQQSFCAIPQQRCGVFSSLKWEIRILYMYNL